MNQLDLSGLAPIVLFTYKRLSETKQTIESLQANLLASESELFIFSDGWKFDADKEKVLEVREYIKSVLGFNKVAVFESSENKGLADSIISGVTQIIEQYGKVIVLEDDLVTSPNFLSYMNSALSHYQDNEKIFSITGYTSPIKKPDRDVYFTQRASSWGWATWKDRWDNIKWDLTLDYELLKKNKTVRKQFKKMGSDVYKMLHKQMTGKIDSWAIRWCYNQFLTQQYTVHPTISRIAHIGTGLSATHVKGKFDRFATSLDETGIVDFNFMDDVYLDNYYLKQFLNNYTLSTRIKYRVLNMLF